jgi:capsular polysaccharide biosynthesis protein
LAQKSRYIVIGLIAALVVLSILNLFGALDHFSTSSEQVDKIVDLTLLAVLIVILMPLVFTITKVKKCPG